MSKYLLFILCFCIPIFINVSQAQDSTVVYSASVQSALISGKTPFWLSANQYGTIPLSGSFVSGQFGLHKIYNPNNPRIFQWSGGAQLVTNVAKSSSVFFTDLYIAGKAGPVELSVGQRREFMGIGDSTISSGSLAMSPNFRPYPKIQIATPNFVNILPSTDLLAFKFSYADGILGSGKTSYGNVSEVPNIYMHQKSLYLRLGGPSHKLSFYAGFNHQAMWGSEEKIFSGGLKTWEAYKYVIVGKPWADSRVGNHFGTIDVAAEWKGKNWNVLLYRQSVYEDGSLANLSNIADGLNGLRFKRVKIDKMDHSFILNTVLFEFLYTKEQGGNVFDFTKGIFGNDNYYNHYVYTQGWSYKGRSLGTPLIGPQSMFRDNIQRVDNLFTTNNRIVGFHMGLKASWNKIDFLFKGTYTQNFGTYNTPIDPSRNQYSVFLNAEKSIPFLKTSLLSLSLVADQGQLYSNTSAITVGWRKVGFIK